MHNNGLKEGKWLTFYDNGQLKTTGEFLNNKETGTWEYFDDNGNLILRENYKNGKIYKPGIKWGWAFRNQAKAFIDYLISSKVKKSNSHGKDSLKDIRIIESIFKK